MTEPTTRQTQPVETAGELRHGILGLTDALAQSIALLSLALGVGTATSAAAIYAAGATPWAYIVALLRGQIAEDLRRPVEEAAPAVPVGAAVDGAILPTSPVEP